MKHFNNLHGYQYRALNHLCDHKSAALFLDMGLGKTVVTLTAIRSWIDNLTCRAAIVVAPLRVAQLVWKAEAQEWGHLQSMKIVQVLGDKKARIAALSQKAEVYVINYDNVIWLADWIAEQDKTVLPFDVLVWDESSKMKSHASRRFKLMKPHLARFARNVLLTGTPSPQSYLDLWSQYFLLDRGERLGQFITHYRDRYFDLGYDGWTYKLKSFAAKEIEERIADITLSLRAADHLTMPKLIINKVAVELPAKVREQYQELEKEMFLQLDKGEVEAFNAAALTNKCRQFTGGAIYTDDGRLAKGSTKRKSVSIHDAKMDALADLIDDAQGQPILVAYEYRHELDRLRERWPRAAVIGSGTKDPEAIVKEWNAGNVPLMFAHPASIGHGVNLQHGGHILVWLTLTWSLELYEQTIARLYRQGQKHPVVVHIMVCKDTIDLAVVDAIASKSSGQAGLLKAIRDYKKKV